MNSFARIARRTAAQFFPRFGPPLACSACGRTPGSGVRLISGPRIYLCSDCFARAAGQLAPRPAPEGALRCDFCRQLRAPADVTQVREVSVCAECLGFMETILAEDRRAM